MVLPSSVQFGCVQYTFMYFSLDVGEGFAKVNPILVCSVRSSIFLFGCWHYTNALSTGRATEA